MAADFFIALFGAIFAWFFIFYSTKEQSSIWTYVTAVFIFVFILGVQHSQNPNIKPQRLFQKHDVVSQIFSVRSRQTSWTQSVIPISASSNKCHIITRDIVNGLGREASQLRVGIVHLFIQSNCATLSSCGDCKTADASSLSFPLAQGKPALAKEQHIWMCDHSCPVCPHVFHIHFVRYKRDVN